MDLERLTTSSSSTPNNNSGNGRSQPVEYMSQTRNASRNFWAIGIREVWWSLILAVVGWYGPKFCLPSEMTLQARDIPFQKTSAGDVILDFELNRPLVDPPTIPCTCTRFFYGL